MNDTTKLARQMFNAALEAGPEAMEAALDDYLAHTTNGPRKVHAVVYINTAKLRPL